jgi:hypothetical protein
MTDPVPSNQWGIDEAFKTLESLTEGSSAAKGAMRFLRSQIERQSASEPCVHQWPDEPQPWDTCKRCSLTFATASNMRAAQPPGTGQ